MFLLLIPKLLLAAVPACDGPIDLDTALGLAATRSDEVAIKQAELTAAEADAAIARALRWFPSATATAVVGPSPEARGTDLLHPAAQDTHLTPWEQIERARPFVRLEVQVVQPLYTWGRLDAARDAATAGVRARQELVQDTTSQVQLRIQQLYWSVSLARKFLAIADDVTKALDDAGKRVAKSLQEGDADVSPSDQYKVDVFKGTVVGRTADAQKGLELARLGLAATLGMEPSRLQLKEAPLETVEGDPPDAAKLLEEAARQRPDLRALDDAIAARAALVSAEKAAMLPQFFVAGQLTYATTSNRDDPHNPWVGDPFNTRSIVPGVIIGFRQDLSFFTLSANAQKAAAERATLEKQRAGLARLVQLQVDSAASELRAARTRFLAAKSSFSAARALYRSAGLDFAAGLLETNPLIEAYKQYVENQITAAQATYDLILARAHLAQATGEQPRKGITCELP